MPFSLVPDRVFDCYADITPDYLAERGVTLLLSDLDFTLAAKKTPHPDQPLRDWIADLAAHGIGFMIVSNNRSGRYSVRRPAASACPSRRANSSRSCLGGSSKSSRAPV